VPIDEEFVASKVGVPVPMLRQLLYKLSLEHVIKYIPCDHATVLFLHHDRLRPKNINLDPERYELLKNSYNDKMQKMIDYVSEEDTCRSAYLLEYFGQVGSQDCGTCDVCRSVGKTSAIDSATAYEDTAAEIVRFINDEMSGSYALDDIARRFSSPGSDSVQIWKKILRRLIDLGTVPPPKV